MAGRSGVRLSTAKNDRVRKGSLGEVQSEGVQRESFFKRTLHWVGETLGVLAVGGLTFYDCAPPPHRIVFDEQTIYGQAVHDSVNSQYAHAAPDTASPFAWVPENYDAVIPDSTTYLKEATNFVQFKRTGSSVTQIIEKDHLLVSFRETAAEEEIQKIGDWLSKRGAMKCGQIPGLRMVDYQIRSGDDLNLVLDHVAAQKAVLTALPNGVLRPQLSPNPHVAGSVYDGYWWIDRIRLREAWDVTTGSASMPVAVLDGGISVKSGHFEGKKITFAVKCRLNDGKVYYLSETQPINECTGIRSYRESAHGTEVASILASRGDDGTGGVGVAWENPLISIDLYGAEDGVSEGSDAITTYKDVNAAIELAIDMGARVVNLSQAPGDNGGKNPITLERTTEFRLALLPAMIKAYQNNILVVIAAGNSGFKNDDQWLPSNRHPSDAKYFRSNALIVGATDDWDDPVCKIDYVPQGERGDLSPIDNVVYNYFSLLDHAQIDFNRTISHCNASKQPPLTVEGKVVEIAAPGYRISIPVMTKNDASMFIPNEGGTSIAAPMVAGAAALVFSQHPDYTAEQVKHILLNSARSGGCRQIGHGILDVAAALGVANEPWNKTYRSFRSFESVRQTRDRGFILATNDGSLVKLNSRGLVLWAHNKDAGIFSLCGTDALESVDGGYVLVGRGQYQSTIDSRGDVDEDIIMEKVDFNGNSLWNVHWGVPAFHDEVWAIQETPDGSLVLAGRVAEGMFLAKADANGNHIWEKRIDLGVHYASASSLVLCEDGGYFVSGFAGNGTDFQNVILKTDAEGEVQWRKSFGRGSWIFRISKLDDGGVVTANGHDGEILNISNTGTLRRNVTHGESRDLFRRVAQTKDGGFIALGQKFPASSSDPEVWLVKLDCFGSIQWEKTFGTPGSDWFDTVRDCTDGGLIMAGRTAAMSSIIKTDKNGNIR